MSLEHVHSVEWGEHGVRGGGLTQATERLGLAGLRQICVWMLADLWQQKEASLDRAL